MKKLTLILLLAVAFSCNLLPDLGKKVTIEKSEVYYKDGATESEARALGEWLLEHKWFDKENRKSAQVRKDGDTYVVRLVVDEKKLEDNDAAIMNVWVMQDMISEEVFKNTETAIVLTDKNLKDLEKLKLDPVASYKPGDKVYIMYNPEEFKKAEAKKVADALEKDGLLASSGQIRIFLTQEDGNKVVRFFMNREQVENHMEEYLPVYKKALYIMEKNAFDGDKIKLYLTDENFEDFKKVPEPTAEEIQQIEQPTTPEQQIVPETNVEDLPPPPQDSSTNN